MKRSLLIVSLLMLCVGVGASHGSALSDLQAFTSGQKVKYDSKGHPKAKGVHMTIEYPKSWQAQEGERPNIVQKFIGKTDNGLSVQCILLIKDTPFLMRFAGDAVFTPEFMRDLVKEMGAEYVNGATTKIEQQSAGWMIYKQDMERAGFKMTAYSLQYMVMYKRKWVQVQFMIGGLQGDEGTQSLFNSYVPLFQTMANTIIFQDKWK